MGKPANDKKITRGSANREKDADDSEQGVMGENTTSNDSVNGKVSIESSVEAIQQSLNEVHTKLDSMGDDHRGTSEELTRNVGITKDLCNRCETLKEETNNLRTELDVLKAAAVKQAQDMQLVKSQLLDLQCRGMRENVLVHNVPEETDENCETKVKDLLSKKSYNKPLDIKRIHRLGQPAKNPSRPRPIVAQLASSGQVEALLKFDGLKRKTPPGDKQDGNRDLKVTPQYPTEIRERRRQLAEIASDFHEKDKSVKTKLTTDALYVNGEKYIEKLTCPTTREVFTMSKAEMEEARETFEKFTEGITAEGGSCFVARALPVQSLNDIRAAYKALLLKPECMAANHNMAAYRLYSTETTKTQDGYCDDGEFGMGRVIRNAMQRADAKNVVVFVTRTYGGQKLGSKRFTLVEQLVENTLAQMPK